MKKSTSMASISLVASAYNDAKNLERWFAVVRKQSRMPDEILIADDGSSGNAVREVIQKEVHGGLRIKHVWHPDHGYQRAKILNRAVEFCASDYLIFTDSDCLMERHFVEDHGDLASDKSFIQGNRAHVLAQHAGAFTPTKLKVLWGVALGRIYNRKCAWRSGILEGFRGRGYWNMPVGANFSCPLSAFYSVNGFDERYQGWGAEDVDLYNRMKLAGIQGVFPRNRCILFHLDHQVRPRNEDNWDLLAESIKSGQTSCELGVNGSLERGPSCILVD